MNNRLDRLERQIERLDRRIDQLDRRVDRIERRLGIRQELNTLILLLNMMLKGSPRGEALFIIS